MILYFYLIYIADIDECADPVKNLCSYLETCYNYNGGYDCSCPDGNRLENDGRTCVGKLQFKEHNAKHLAFIQCKSDTLIGTGLTHYQIQFQSY